MREIACPSCGVRVASIDTWDRDDSEETARRTRTETRCLQCGTLVTLRWPTSVYDVPRPFERM
jgi:hypothetical protein